MDEHEDCISRYEIECVFDEAKRWLDDGCSNEAVLQVVLFVLEELLKRG